MYVMCGGTGVMMVSLQYKGRFLSPGKVIKFLCCGSEAVHRKMYVLIGVRTNHIAMQD